jgi:O-antigen/teichoic acid export membrane protein
MREQELAPRLLTMSSPLKRTGKNFALLLGGQGTGGLLSLAALFLMAHGLSREQLGIVILVQAYVVTVRELLNFKPFEAIVRYGVPKLDDGDRSALKRLLWFSLKLDVSSSFVALVLAIACVPWVGPLIRLPQEHAGLAMAFGAVLLFSSVGTAKGVLRLYGRFDVLSLMAIVGSGTRLLGAVAAYAMQGGIPEYALAWALSIAVEYSYVNVMAWREIRRQLPDVAAVEPVARDMRPEFPGLWTFVNVVYWQSNLDLVPKRGATLMAGWLLGPAGVAAFGLMREIAAAIAKPAVLLRHAVFPDLTRLWHQRDYAFRELCFRLALWMGAPALLLVIVVATGGAPLVRVLLGAEYVEAVPLLTLLVLGAAMELMTATLRPAGYATNQATIMLWIQTLSMILYVILFTWLTPRFGLIGPGLATCLSMLVAVAGMVWVLLRTLRALPAR